jgi:hypothetical protein
MTPQLLRSRMRGAEAILTYGIGPNSRKLRMAWPNSVGRFSDRQLDIVDA